MLLLRTVLVYAGIDEAGYGPLLGPLCVGCSVFVLDDYDPAEGPPDLWRLLRRAVCRRPTDRKRRIAVDDSKTLKGPKDGAAHPLRHLERGVLSFCPGGSFPRSDDELLRLLGTTVPDHPWCAGQTALPLGGTPEALGIARARLERAWPEAGLRCEALWCEAIDVADLNRRLTDTGNKAAVNFRVAVDLVERVWRRWPDGHPRIVIDRHGGRTSYGPVLERSLSGSTVEVIAETPTLSRYTVRRDDSAVTISFALNGDSRFLPVALASMTAKYVRELLMLRLNRFFQEALPALKPTAGYFQDARRYLTEIKPVMKRLRLSPAELVRRA